MDNSQKDFGYNGFVKELNHLVNEIHEFSNFLAPEADTFYWKHISSLSNQVSYFKTASFLKSSNMRKIQLFNAFISEVRKFQEKILSKQSRLRTAIRIEERNERITQILLRVKNWERIALELDYNYICKL